MTRGRGFFIRDSPSAESLGRSQGGPEGGSLGRNQAGPEGGHAPPASAVHGADAQGLVPEVAEGIGNPNTNPSLSPGVLRTVTERSESLLLDEGDAGAAPAARNGVEQHGGAPLLMLNGEAPHEGTALVVSNGASGQGLENGKAHAGGPGGGLGPGESAKGMTAGAAQVSAASEEFSEKRQVPPGKLAVLLLLFAGGAPPERTPARSTTLITSLRTRGRCCVLSRGCSLLLKNVCSARGRFLVHRYSPKQLSRGVQDEACRLSRAEQSRAACVKDVCVVTWQKPQMHAC